MGKRPRSRLRLAQRKNVHISRFVLQSAVLHDRVLLQCVQYEVPAAASLVHLIVAHLCGHGELCRCPSPDCHLARGLAAVVSNVADRRSRRSWMRCEISRTWARSYRRVCSISRPRCLSGSRDSNTLQTPWSTRWCTRRLRRPCTASHPRRRQILYLHRHHHCHRRRTNIDGRLHHALAAARCTASHALPHRLQRAHRAHRAL